MKPAGNHQNPVSRDWIQQTLRYGFRALEQGDIRAASECCQKVLAAEPELVPAHFLVGLVALQGRDRKTAYSAFGSVTGLDPNHAAAWAHLARLYMSEGQVNRADAAMNEVQRCQSRDPIVLDLVGTVYSMMGEYDLARESFSKANRGQPNHPPFMLNLGNSLVYNGDTDTAEKIFNQIVTLQPDSPQAHWSLSTALKAQDHQHIHKIEPLILRKGQSHRAMAFYFYALGKQYEDLQEWENAFKAFRLGAKARRKTVAFDEQSEIELYQRIESLYTREWLADQQAGNPDPAPIFVLGQPRTGTTLIERIITSHSQVHSAGELQQFGIAARRMTNHQDPKRFSVGLFEAARHLDGKKLGTMYLDTTRKMQGDTPRFVDKLPLNYLFLPLILKALPKAKIIHLTRNPMDACFASFKQLFADAYLHSYEQQEMARHHARYLHLMAAWRERFPDRFLDISYEGVVHDLESGARKLINYLELPWEAACLEFHKQASAVSTASAVQVREPVHSRSVGRWRHYENQLAPMLEELKKQGVENIEQSFNI